MFEGLPRLYEGNLFSTLFDDSEPFKQLNDNLKKGALNMGIKETLSMAKVGNSFEIIKGCKLTNKILPGDEAISLGIKLLVNFIELSMITRDSIG